MKVTSSFPSAIRWNCYKIYPSEVQPVLYYILSCLVLCFLPSKRRCLMWTCLGPFSLSTYMNLNVWVPNNPWTSEWHLGIVNIWMGDFSKRKPTWVQIILPVLTSYIAIFDRSGLWILSSKRKLIMLMGAFESTCVSFEWLCINFGWLSSWLHTYTSSYLFFIMLHCSGVWATLGIVDKWSVSPDPFITRNMYLHRASHTVCV